MHAPHQEGRARPSLFFVLDLRLSSMDSVGVHTLGSAAAQGGQDTSSEHANGSPFTGWELGLGRPGIAGRVLSIGEVGLMRKMCYLAPLQEG